MLTLKLRGKVWYARGTVAGVRVYESTRTSDKTQAERYRANREAQIYNQAQFGQRGTHSFSEAVNLYLEGRSDLGHTSRRTLLELLDTFGHMQLTHINQEALDRYIRKRHPAAAPSHIIRSVIVPVTAVMRVAAKRSWCDVPAFDRPKVKAHKARFLSYDEAGALIASASEHLAPLLTFLLNTGCRIGEALTLRWYAVDLQSRLIVLGKTDNDKTKNDETRGVPLNRIAFLALANLPHRDGHVFLSNLGKPYPMREGGGQISTGFRAACRRAEIGHLRVHDLRHTFASWISMAGYHEATIAELLGHKSRKSSITGRYTHLNLDHLRSAVESIVDGQGGAKSVQPRVAILEGS